MIEINKNLTAYAENVEGEIKNKDSMDLTCLVVPYRSFKIHYDLLPVSQHYKVERFLTRARVVVKNPSRLKFKLSCGELTHKTLKIIGLGGIECDDEEFDNKFWYRANNKEIAEQLMVAEIRKTLVSFNDVHLDFVKEHSMDVNCIEGESCIILSSSEIMVSQERIGEVILLMKNLIDRMINLVITDNKATQTNLLK